MLFATCSMPQFPMSINIFLTVPFLMATHHNYLNLIPPGHLLIFYYCKQYLMYTTVQTSLCFPVFSCIGLILKSGMGRSNHVHIFNIYMLCPPKRGKNLCISMHQISPFPTNWVLTITFLLYKSNRKYMPSHSSN